MIASNVSWKRFYAIFLYFSVPSFVVLILWPELRIYAQGVWFFEKFENTINELRWYDKPILTSKISITSFAEFDIKIVFLGQNNFE